MEELAGCGDRSNKPGVQVFSTLIYEITGDLAGNKNEKLVPHMAHTVEVTGDVTTDPGGAMKIAGASLKMISK